jgi:F-type H+-transporting ATPase subunit delta
MRAPVRRYADALFAAAGDLEANRAALEELEAVVAALREVPAAARLLAYRAVRPDVAERLLRALEEHLSPRVARFVRLVSERGRLLDLPAIVEAYRARLEAAQGVVRARVEAARPLPADDLRRLAEVLARRLGAEVQVSQAVREDLLGGARVVVGDRVLDGTLDAHLERMRRRLLAPRA